MRTEESLSRADPAPERSLETRKPGIVLWDNDGVLVETESFYFEATRSVLASVGIELTESDYQDLFLRKAAGAWHFAKARGFSDDEVKELRRRRFDLYSELVRGQDIVIPGVQESLERLRSRYRHAIVTSSRRHHFNIIHERSGLLEYFEFVLTREDYDLSKPHPEPYLKALQLAGVPAAESLVIEDSERGLEAAVAAGIPCWIVPSRLTRSLSFARAERILGSVKEVADLLTGQ